MKQKNKKKKALSRMFCGPYYPEELSWRKKKEGSVDLTICLGSPSSVFVSSLGPSV